ncbi:MAG: nuclear transport factor 2 family protein [Sphingomonas sp.]|uniref:nuclear transport factor 2 family protein n=1 Tax=Sphingomonas sp. TaxID=28214 RepID=UPI0025D17D74|nr:nuclear transport factor 2 family protein [Sphingomonas sp.]MBX9882692.1 nuclear transport factor 2 family protein [Sphingomonas sp.]
MRLMALAALALAAPAAAQTANPFTPAVEAQMREAERVWADIAVTGDPTPLKTILADDYVGVSSSGKVVTKADQLVPGTKGEFIASGIDYINYRQYGDTVVAQGAEWVRRADKKPDLRLIWIDIWKYRDGRWQIIASQDSRRPE